MGPSHEHNAPACKLSCRPLGKSRLARRLPDIHNILLYSLELLKIRRHASRKFFRCARITQTGIDICCRSHNRPQSSIHTGECKPRKYQKNVIPCYHKSSHTSTMKFVLTRPLGSSVFRSIRQGCGSEDTCLPTHGFHPSLCHHLWSIGP